MKMIERKEKKRKEMEKNEEIIEWATISCLIGDGVEYVEVFILVVEKNHNIQTQQEK